MPSSLRKVIRGWIRILLGLVVFSFGVHCTIRANIGLAPWDCLGMGISLHTPLSYGMAMTMTSLVILGIDILMKERIGFGTVIDALCTGNFTEFYNQHSPVPRPESLTASILLLLAGLTIMVLGMAVYMKAGQSCGPRDSLLVGLGKRFPRCPIGLVNILLQSSALLIGWLLGGAVGIGTIVSSFGCGLVMQLVYHVIRFEPRNIIHQDIRETILEIQGK